MHAALLQKIFEQWKADGRLAIVANLLYTTVFIGWIAFAGLYAVEVLLPTFVAARLSLVKFAILLLLLTSVLAWLGQILPARPAAVPEQNEKNRRLLMLGLLVTSIGVVALAHYRFPWWSIPLSILGYGCIVWQFWTFPRTTTNAE